MKVKLQIVDRTNIILGNDNASCSVVVQQVKVGSPEYKALQYLQYIEVEVPDVK
jgi:hypothetical protein